MNLESLVKSLSEFSSSFGSGNLTADVLFLAIGLSLFAMLLGVASYKKSAANNVQPSLERVSGIGGRVEKLEMTLNEFRSDTLRSIELFRGDVGYLKQELREIRRVLSKLDPEGGGGYDEGGDESVDSGGDLTGGSSASAPRVEVAPPVEVIAAIPEQLEEQVEAAPEIEERGFDVKDEEPQSLFARLQKSRRGLLGKIKDIFSGKPKVDADMLEELEATLVSTDLGVKISSQLISELQEELKRGDSLSQEDLLERLKQKALALLKQGGSPTPMRIEKRSDGPLVVLVVGINGVGKTTTTAKLAHVWKESGANVVLAAADTFRAAAVEQLMQWGKRIGVPVVSGAPDAKPGTVVFDAMVEAKRRNADVLIIDTAGRLHTKSNLMQELEGIKNVMQKHQADAPHEILLVVDGATGQNALNQAREFNAAVKLSGLIVTKLDGTPKGGIVVAIKDELKIPIRFIGVGESKGDLRPFVAEEFVEALFSNASEIDMQESKRSAHALEREKKRVVDQPHI